MNIVHLPSSFLFLRISNCNRALTGPEQGGSNAAKRSSKQEKPFIPITIVAIQTSCIGRVERCSDKQRPLRSNLVGNAASQKAAHGHESKGQRIGSIVQVGLPSLVIFRELSTNDMTYFGISPCSQIVQGGPNPRLAEGDESNDDDLEQTRPVEPGYMLEGHGRLDCQSLSSRADRTFIILPEHVKARYHRDMLFDVSCFCSRSRPCMQNSILRIDYLSYRCNSSWQTQNTGLLPRLHLGVAACPIKDLFRARHAPLGWYIMILGRHNSATNKRHIRKC